MTQTTFSPDEVGAPQGFAPDQIGPPERKSPLQRLGAGVVGAAESALSMGTGAIATPVAGLVGLTNLPFGAERAAELTKAYQEGLTYEPRTEQGRTDVELLSYPFSKYTEKVSGPIAEFAAERSGPAVGAATKASLEMLPALLSKAGRPVAERAKDLAMRDAFQRQQLKENLTIAKEHGYAVSPNEAQTGLTGRTLESLAGESKSVRTMSRKNQERTNELVREDIGLPADARLNHESLQDLRRQAGQDYEAVSRIGRVPTDRQYHTDLGNILKSYEEAAKSFPGGRPPPIKKELEIMRVPGFEAGSAVAMVRMLRDKADTAFRQGDAGLGREYRAAAKTLDDQLARHVIQRPDLDPKLVDRYLNSRKRIAKIHMAEDALNEATGNIDAAVYGKAFKEGAPLSGQGAVVGRIAAQFPKSTKLSDTLHTTGPTLFDVGLGFGGGVLEALHSGGVGGKSMGAAAALGLSRPATRYALSTRPGQSLFVQHPTDLPRSVRLMDLATMRPEFLALTPGLSRESQEDQPWWKQ